MKICITLCTRNRPRMLAQCLESLIPAIAAVPQAQVFVVLVENAAEPLSQAVVDGFQGRLAITYALEPEPGIPFARNRSLDLALEQGAEWVIFIDDDEWVEPGWLAVLLEAPARFPGVEVFSGPRLRVYPPETPAWFPRRMGETRLPTGTRRPSAYTANTMAAAQLFRPPPEGRGLRFDPRFRMTGGSDTDLFLRHTRAGGEIVWIDEAILSEEFPASRTNLRWNWDRHVRLTNNMVFLECHQLGRLRGIGQSVRAMAALVPMAVLRLGYGLACLPFDPVRGRKQLFSAAMKLAGIRGYLLGLAGHQVNPYRKTEGD